jgi:hypothetical protein
MSGHAAGCASYAFCGCGSICAEEAVRSIARQRRSLILIRKTKQGQLLLGGQERALRDIVCL